MVYSLESIKSKSVNTLKKYGVTKVDLFGSYADGTAKEDSDIDLLVEFKVASVSLFLISQLKYELEENLGKSVDVIHGPLPEEAMIQPSKVVSLYEQ
jgi:predicted nucleotidyltransferase